MMNLSAIRVLILTFVLAISGPALSQTSPVVLTLYGEIKNSNRGGINKFHDGFLSYHELEFDGAYELDLVALEKLDQQQLTVNAEGWDKPVDLSGPLLSDVLELAGYSGTSISLMALDGYAVELNASDLAGKNWILAMRKEGKPLSIGGRGPLWLVHETAVRPATSDEEGKWVWSVFAISAR